MTPKSEVHLIDCMAFLRGCKDNQFDLAVVDPPYGIGEDKTKRPSRGKTYTKPHTSKDWDKETVSEEYFNELQRVSKNQIVWGANHFIEKINKNSSCWLVWNKKTSGNNADCELAWSSFKTAVRRFDFMWEGFWQENMKDKETRIHPTQKPIQLYDWIFRNYAKHGDTILDTHMGSQSSRISAHKAGLDYTGCELDPEYFEQGNERFHKYLLKSGTTEPDKAMPGQQINIF
jgi:site-specific DNA-methyltransferase (adenine-specific)